VVGGRGMVGWGGAGEGRRGGRALLLLLLGERGGRTRCGAAAVLGRVDVDEVEVHELVVVVVVVAQDELLAHLPALALARDRPCASLRRERSRSSLPAGTSRDLGPRRLVGVGVVAVRVGEADVIALLEGHERRARRVGGASWARCGGRGGVWGSGTARQGVGRRAVCWRGCLSHLEAGGAAARAPLSASVSGQDKGSGRAASTNQALVRPGDFYESAVEGCANASATARQS